MIYVFKGILIFAPSKESNLPGNECQDSLGVLVENKRKSSKIRSI